MLAVVVAGIIESGQSCGRDRRPAASLLATAVADATVGVFAFVDIFFGGIDHLGADWDPGIAATPQALHLGDGGGAFVEVIAFAGRDVTPAAGGGLGVTTKLDCL